MPNVRPLWVDARDPALDTPFCCWPECGAPIYSDELDIPLCRSHFIRVGDRFARAFRERMGLTFSRSILGREPTDEDRAYEAKVQRRQAAYDAQCQVYYVRIGDHVKIGFSQNMKSRLNQLRIDVEDVLATEPGNQDLERQRHQEFAAERVGRRENFNPSPRLLAHIAQVRETHGEPNITGYLRVS